ncbi:MAG: tetratricopeptide repeat protein [Alphaproteobacteria bacterium]|nr:tetratricopeptide repeat protein [Alphaproteobacteria bacterium]
MKKNKTSLLDEIYFQHLQAINGIKLTRREIDIIAFFICGRSAKKIAGFFSISPKTVENHVHNIMVKLDCNSREGIIDFVEKSDKLPLLRKYYAAALAQTIFEKSLVEISKLTSSHKVSCVLLSDSEQVSEGCLAQCLENSLKRAGVTVSNAVVGFSQSVQDFCKNKCGIYVKMTLSEDEQEKELRFYFVSQGKESFVEFPQRIGEAYSLDIAVQKNYYLFIFDIFELLFPQFDLHPIVEEFLKQYEGAEAQLSLTEREEDPQLRKREQRLTPFLIRRNWYLGGGFIILLCVITVLFSSFLNRDNHPHDQELTSLNKVARSDLDVPTDSVLLNRPELLGQIEERFRRQKKGIQTVALVGVGGAGKTTLAHQYAFAQKAPVLWEINAETKEDLQASFENLAQALAKSDEDQKILPGLFKVRIPLEREMKILQFVKERLRAQKNWFLIFDNVQQFNDIQNHFPKDPEIWGQGRIILTTRDRNIESNAYVSSAIVVGELNPEQKLALFQKIMNNGASLIPAPKEQEETKQFLEEISPFPLDVSVAAYYIKATNVPYKNYLENMLKHSIDFSLVQEKILQEAGAYTKTRYGIIMLSLKQLIDTNPDFQDLLLFISLLDPHKIPRQLLVKFKGNIVVDNFIYHLKKYSLLTNDATTSYPGEHVFSIHQSTRAIILAYLTKKLNLTKHKNLLESQVQSLENYMRESVEKEDFSTMKNLYRHAEYFLTHEEFLNEESASSLRGELGCIYCYLRHSSKAKALLTESLLSLKRCCGEQHHKIAHFLVYLGNANRSLGDYEEAKKLFEQSMQIYKKYAPNDVGMAKASGYLGAVYHTFGDFEEAKTYLERAQSIYKKHPQNRVGVAWSLAHLANVYGTLGEYEEAIRLFMQSMETYKAQAKDYVGAAWAEGDLGAMYVKIGNFEKARHYFEESLAICRKHFSEDHAYMAEIFSHFGVLYLKEGNYKRAKEFFQKARGPLEETYGVDHIETAYILKGLGEVAILEGNFDQSGDHLNRALLIFQKHKHPDQYLVLEALSDLSCQKALAAKTKEDHQGYEKFRKEAEAYLQKALEHVNTNFPTDSPHLRRLQDKVKERSREENSPSLQF